MWTNFILEYYSIYQQSAPLKTIKPFPQDAHLMIRKAILLMAAVCLTMTANAQENWTLEKCRAYYNTHLPYFCNLTHDRKITKYGFKMYVGIELSYRETGAIMQQANDADASTFEARYAHPGAPIPIEVAEKLLHDNFPNLTWTRQPVPPDNEDLEGDLAWTSSDPSITANEESNGTVHLTWFLTIAIKLTP